MEQKEFLTTELLKRKFKSQFDLVNYAIRRADHAIRSGREPIVDIDSQNLALRILAEITEEVEDAEDYSRNKENMNEIVEDVPFEEYEEEVEAPRPKSKSASKR